MARRSHVWSDPRVKPPWGATELDRSHPLARNMVLCLPMTERGNQLLTDMTGNRAVWIQQDTDVPFHTPWQATRLGVGPLIGARSPDRMLKMNPEVSISSGTSFSDFLLADIKAFNGANPGGWRSSSGTDTFHIYQGSSANRVWVRGGGAELLVPSSGPALTVGPHSESVVVNSGVGTTQYIDGVAVQSATHATTVLSFAFQLIGVQGGLTGGTLLEGYYQAFYFWARALTSSEVQWLNAEPYAMLRPIVKRRYFAPAAAGGSIVPKAMHYTRMRA